MWEPVPLFLATLGCVFAKVDEYGCPGPLSNTTFQDSDNPWLLHRSSETCYRMFTLKHSLEYSFHKDSCKQFGYQLAEPRKWAQNEFLVNHVNTSGFKFIGVKKTWLAETAKYEWCFLSDNKPVAFGNDSQFETGKKNSGFCIGLLPGTNKWNGVDCHQSKTRYHVCETPTLQGWRAVRDVAVDAINEGVAKKKNQKIIDTLRDSPVLGLNLSARTDAEIVNAIRERWFTRGAPLTHADVKAAISEACPSGWSTPSTHAQFAAVSCFRVGLTAKIDKVDVYKNGLNWFEGKAVCGHNKSRIALPKNVAENVLIAHLVSQSDGDFGWLGITRPDDDVNNWQPTADDATSVRWENWMTGEPSDKPYHYCGKVSRGGGWSVERCDMETTEYKTVAVCERDIVNHEEQFQAALAADDVVRVMDVLSNVGLVDPLVVSPRGGGNDIFELDNYIKNTFDKLKAGSANNRAGLTLKDAQILFANEQLVKINELVMNGVMNGSLLDAMQMWGVRDSEVIGIYTFLKTMRTAKADDLDESDVIKAITDRRMSDLNDIIANKKRDPHDLVILLNIPPLSDQELEIPLHLTEKEIVLALRKYASGVKAHFTIETFRQAIQDITVASLTTTPAPTTTLEIDIYKDEAKESQNKHPPVVYEKSSIHGGVIVGGAMGFLTVVWVTFAFFISKKISRRNSDDENSSIFLSNGQVEATRKRREDFEDQKAMKVMTKFMENEALLADELNCKSEENVLKKLESAMSAVLNSPSRIMSAVLRSPSNNIAKSPSKTRSKSLARPSDVDEEIIERTSSGAFKPVTSIRDLNPVASVKSVPDVDPVASMKYLRDFKSVLSMKSLRNLSDVDSD